MDAKVKNRGEVMVINITGALEIEHTRSFRDVCIKKLINKKLVFNMQGANFVGSTGLQAFFETVRTLSEGSAHGLKMVGLSPDFLRIFQNMEINQLQIHDTEEVALQSFAVIKNEADSIES
jgi:anti-anti-sigma factor